jgi:hypothetical protein
VDILAHTREELEDFQATSRELEAEMEADLDRSAKLEKELREKLAKAETERDEWKVGRFATVLRAPLPLTLCPNRISTCPFKQPIIRPRHHFNGSSTSCARNTNRPRLLSGTWSWEPMISSEVNASHHPA